MAPASQFSLNGFPDNSHGQVCGIPWWAFVRCGLGCPDREKTETNGASQKAVSVFSQGPLGARLSQVFSIFSAQSASQFLAPHCADAALRGGDSSPPPREHSQDATRAKSCRTTGQQSQFRRARICCSVAESPTRSRYPRGRPRRPHRVLLRAASLSMLIHLDPHSFPDRAEQDWEVW